ncbi:uncharacterized protein LOC100904743, partial [Galendromus occidentalis]|uniref:Uncharacterized protein LOC100904743 n=1 Tax=Galendromus occidentalis TaxID=34638 RepID=A0AAJ6QNM0_9ACAR
MHDAISPKLKCPASVVKLKTNHESYSSFCIFVDEDDEKILLDPSFWATAKPGALDALRMFCSSEDIDVLFIAETWFDATIRDAELSFGGNYQVFRLDRPTRGGGVCALLKKCFSAVHVDLNLPGEHIVFDIVTTYSRIRFLCYYLSQTGDSALRRQKITEVCAVIDAASDVDSSLIVVGDFNLPHISWPNPSIDTSHSRENLFVKCCYENNLAQLVIQPTHKDGAILDLLLTTDPDIVSDLLVTTAPVITDHLSLRFSVIMPAVHVHSISSHPDYQRMDEHSIAAVLDRLNWLLVFDSCKSVNDMYNSFVRICSSLIKDFVPSTRSSSTINSVTSCLDRIRRRANMKNPSSARELMKASRRLRLLTEAKLNPSDPRRFFRYVNGRLRQHDSVPTLISDTKIFSTDSEKAEALSRHFASVYSTVGGTALPAAMARVNPFPDARLEFPEALIYETLRELKGTSNLTPEGIPPLFFKKFALFVAEPLALIFERSYNDSEVPSLFRQSIVTPVYKKGKRSSTENYRPIAQGSIACKVLEKIVARHLMGFLERNRLMDPRQHGFVKYRSTCTQLLLMSNDWASYINQGLPFHVVYFDQKNAFDRINHDKL